MEGGEGEWRLRHAQYINSDAINVLSAALNKCNAVRYPMPIQSWHSCLMCHGQWSLLGLDSITKLSCQKAGLMNYWLLLWYCKPVNHAITTWQNSSKKQMRTVLCLLFFFFCSIAFAFYPRGSSLFHDATFTCIFFFRFVIVIVLLLLLLLLLLSYPCSVPWTCCLYLVPMFSLWLCFCSDCCTGWLCHISLLYKYTSACQNLVAMHGMVNCLRSLAAQMQSL